MQTIFIKSSPTINECPPANFPEIAFVGRSNVGKSSLINMLCQRKKLTKVSDKPGKTRLINHFLIDNQRYLVDLPGYGYAKASNAEQEQRVHAMYDFLTERSTLVHTFLLLDAKLPPQAIDEDFVRALVEESITFSAVFTKTDKVSQKDFHHHLNAWQQLFQSLSKPPLVFSTSSIKKKGRTEILTFIEKIIG